jgi:nucleotide-binding universal stress UspA family protein
VTAEAHAVHAEDMDAGAMLLSRAADESVDLIVMGAYGRSRLRELVLGGATRHIVRHMTIPVLMSH